LQGKIKVIKILRNIVIIGGLLLIFLIGYIVLNPGKKRMVAKARRLHKKGELFYSEGDVDLAEEYYSEAEQIRSVAKEMA